MLHSCGALAAGVLAARAGAETRLSAAAKAPVLLVTPAMLTEARRRIAAKETLGAAAWEKTLIRATDSLKVEVTPYQGEEYLPYFHAGRGQAGLAR
ncbi:MAG: hypothetical protein V4671_11550, partial [Armatimonadota bacterium]